MGISTQQLVQSPVMEIKHYLLCPHLPIHLKLEKLIHLEVQVNQTSHWGGKARISNQASGRDSFLYGGAQVIGATGAMGLAYGDQNFPGTPTHLPGQCCCYETAISFIFIFLPMQLLDME